MRNAAAEVFCSTATSKCTKMEKCLESLLKNNHYQKRKIPLTAWVPASSFQPSPADAARAPPCLPASPYMQTALQILHMTKFTSHILVFGTVWVPFIYRTYTIYILYKMIWAILPLHTQLATAAPWQIPKSTGRPSTADFFLCNCSPGFTLIYCICPHGFFLVPVVSG